MNEYSDDLAAAYQLRFAGRESDRARVWQVLIGEYFQSLIGNDKAVLDLGCGWGEFINQVQARERYAIDLNPDAEAKLHDGVNLLLQDCSEPWQLADDSLDVVFKSNFFEHLPSKTALARTLDQAHRCWRPGGRIICMGPNIGVIPGKYWDFWDHYLELTERSMAEGLALRGFTVERAIRQFLPYTMSDKTLPANWMISLYLKLPIVWKFFGEQFLVVGTKVGAE